MTFLSCRAVKFFITPYVGVKIMHPRMYPLIQGIVGSTAYGLNTANSDIDRLGVFTYETEAFFQLEQPKESLVSTNPDVTQHEAVKACKLLLSCNPTVTEILWLPESLYEYKSSLGKELIELKHSFLSAKRVKDAYLGYASQQFQRLLKRGDGKFDSDTGNRTAKHARHLKRLTVQGYQLYTTGTLNIRVDDPQSYLDFGESVAKYPELAIPYMSTMEDKFKTATTKLPEVPDKEIIVSWLKRVRREYYSF